MTKKQSPKQSRKIQDIIQFKPLDEINPKRVVMIAGTGLFVGALWGVLSQIAKFDLKGNGLLDPPAPNMQKLEPELVILYQKFMGPFYRLCPRENKQKFKEYVQKSIKNAEAIMLIENQLHHNEIPRTQNNRTQSAAHGMICMNSLRKVQNLFHTEIVENVKDAVDVVFVNIGKF